MLAAGEDPRFILRRLLVLAGEDIGLGDPNGLVVAAAAAYTYEYIGLPEGIYPLVEATLIPCHRAQVQFRWSFLQNTRITGTGGHRSSAGAFDG